MEELRIVLASSASDRRRFAAFVRYHVRRRYGGTPRPSQILLFAERKGRICGTIALDFADDQTRFPLEAIYQLDSDPPPFFREETAQFGKWWATRPGASIRLMHTAHVFALSHGKRFGIAEAKPKIASYVARLGMSLQEVPGAILLAEAGLARGEGYYRMPPPPRLYMFNLTENLAALSNYMEDAKGS